MQLTNNTILITGGSAGIGLALARSFVSLGNRVVICGRSRERLGEARALCPELQTIVCDITDPEQQQVLRKQISEDYPDLNVLVNNAGIQQQLDFSQADFPCEKIRTEINTNLSAQLELTALLLPLLQTQSSSALLFMGSALARVPKKSTPVYCASKAAIHSFVRTLRYQLEASTTEVIEIIPDLVDTAMTQYNPMRKMSTEALATAVISGLKKGRCEIRVGRTGVLFALHRLFPALAYRLLKNN